MILALGAIAQEEALPAGWGVSRAVLGMGGPGGGLGGHGRSWRPSAGRRCPPQSVPEPAVLLFGTGILLSVKSPGAKLRRLITIHPAWSRRRTCHVAELFLCANRRRPLQPSGSRRDYRAARCSAGKFPEFGAPQQPAPVEGSPGCFCQNPCRRSLRCHSPASNCAGFSPCPAQGLVRRRECLPKHS